MTSTTEERLLKGCGNDWEDKDRVIHTCGRYLVDWIPVLCPICSAKLEQHRQTKAEYEFELNATKRKLSNYRNALNKCVKEKADCLNKSKEFVNFTSLSNVLCRFVRDKNENRKRATVYGYGELQELIVLIEKELMRKADEMFNHSQTRQSKETSVEKGGDKAERYLFNSDNVSSADTFSKEDSENICICGHHTIDHSYDPNKLDADLECDICDCKRFRTKEDRSFLGGYAEFWDNSEDDRWDKEEEKQDE